LMGLLEPVYRLPMVPPSAASWRGSRACCNPADCWRGLPLQAEIERLFDEKPEAYTEAHRRMFYEFKTR